MPNALTAIIGGDSGPFEKEMKALEDSAARHSRKIEDQLGQSRGKTGGITIDPEAARLASVEAATRNNRARAIRRERAERQAIAQEHRNAEISAGSIPESWTIAIDRQKKFKEQLNLSRAGMLQLGHTIRATFDSIASGANPIRVLFQQGPQLAQSLLLIGGRFAVLGGIIAGSAAAVLGLGFAINYVVNKYYDVANAAGESFEKQRKFWHEMRQLARDQNEIDFAADAAKIASHDALLEQARENTDLEMEITKQKMLQADLDAKRLGKTVDEFSTKKQIAQMEKERLQQKLADAKDDLNSNTIGSGERQKLREELSEADRDKDSHTEKGKAKVAAIQKAIEDNFAQSHAVAIGKVKALELKIAEKDTAIKQIAVDEKGKPHLIRGNQTDLQRVGAFISPSSVTLIDLNRKMERHLHSINTKLGHRHTGTNPHSSRRQSAPRF